MPILKYKKLGVALVFGVFGNTAHALSLGDMTVMSYADEPFSAVVVVNGFDASFAYMHPTIRVINSDVPVSVKMVPAKDGVEGYLELNSVAPIVGAIIEIEVELQGGLWRMSHLYTMLPDPRPHPVQAASKEELAKIVNAPKVTPSASSTEAIAKEARKDGLYVIKRGDTLIRIAKVHYFTPYGIKIQHAVDTIIEANPRRIYKKKMIKAGEELVLPYIIGPQDRD